jgi:hypothetical protein
MVAFPTKIALMAGLILLVVVSFAAYSKYLETKAWIFGDGPYGTAIEMTLTPHPNFDIHVTREELARYPTAKAYIDYIDSMPGRTPLSSMSIDPWEARLLVFFLSQKASYEVKPEPGLMGESYSFHIVLSGIGYGINIVFSNERPILD